MLCRARQAWPGLGWMALGPGLMVWSLLVVLTWPGAPRAEDGVSPADRPPAVGDAAVAGQVVLELYTSQGCSACPPADELLAALAPREDVIALALHVDYWDYIGWADVFADPENGERQKRYARRNGLGTIYTPQVVIEGTEILEGFRAMQILDLIDRHRAAGREIRLTLERGEAGSLEISAEALAGSGLVMASRAPASRALAAMAADESASGGAHEVQLVRYLPRAVIEITEGENAGRTTEYHNIVTSWQTVAQWDPRLPLYLSVPVEGDQPVVVIVQQAGQGAIVAAARLR